MRSEPPARLPGAPALPPVSCSLSQGWRRKRHAAPVPASSFQEDYCIRRAGAILGNWGLTLAWPEEQPPPAPGPVA